jgi:uncharacterized membrane protein YhaH (DUF805 family)
MDLDRFFSKHPSHVGRLRYALFACFFLDAITHLATWGASQRRTDSVFYLICYIFFVLVWLLMTVGRLHELRLSLLWILSILVPQFVLVLSLRADWGWLPLGAFVIALAVQLPLIFLSPRKDLTTTEIASFDGPRT